MHLGDGLHLLGSWVWTNRGIVSIGPKRRRTGLLVGGPMSCFDESKVCLSSGNQGQRVSRRKIEIILQNLHCFNIQHNPLLTVGGENELVNSGKRKRSPSQLVQCEHYGLHVRSRRSHVWCKRRIRLRSLDIRTEQPWFIYADAEDVWLDALDQIFAVLIGNFHGNCS